MNSLNPQPFSTQVGAAGGSSLRNRSLLSQATIPQTQAAPEDCYESTATSGTSWGKTLAFVGMGALSLAPAVSQAKDVGGMISEQVPELGDLFAQQHHKIGEYNLTFQPADLSINPSFHGLKPGLRVRGDLLKTEFAKSEKLTGGWTVTSGIRGALNSEFRTNGDNHANLNLEAFKRWDGSLGGDVKGMFEVAGGTYHNLLDRNTSVGVHLRQEVRGGNFTLMGQPVSWHIDGRENFGRVVSGQAAPGQSDWNYEVLVGVRRDFPMQVWGHKATLQVVAGPEVSGDQFKQFKINPKVRARVSF